MVPEGETESGLFMSPERDRWDPGGRSAGRQGVYDTRGPKRGSFVEGAILRALGHLATGVGFRGHHCHQVSCPPSPVPLLLSPPPPTPNHKHFFETFSIWNHSLCCIHFLRRL